MTRTNPSALHEWLAASLCLAGWVLAAPAQAQLPPSVSDDAKVPLRSTPIQRSVSVEASQTGTIVLSRTAHKVKADMWIAYRMARDPWIDKACAADPRLVAAICAHPGPAKLLAKHHHVAAISEADPFFCRRLTRWKGATWALIKNRFAEKVITRDPQGIYWAIDRNPKVARVLAKNLMFNQMVVENPDLGKFVSRHM